MDARRDTPPVERARPVGRLLLPAALLTGTAAAIAGLAPGGLGDPDPVRVSTGPSAEMYRSVASLVAGTPEWAYPIVALAAEAVIVVLLLAVALLWWVRRHESGVPRGLLLTLAGTTATYAISEAVKLVVDEERPCRAVPGVGPIPDCPAIGDWSFPSNHTTVAAALAVGLVLVRWRLWPVLLLAVAAAALRVAGGVHYPHDVLAGAILGGGGTAALLVLAGFGRPAAAGQKHTETPSAGHKRANTPSAGRTRAGTPAVDAPPGTARPVSGWRRRGRAAARTRERS
ncbi:phosphatase PAP2 family protein [Plantactinospora sp. GCM10030261]|uniref:phosphatase PAP2 family protein n=1 Tax=Plantactinospora sp. GCM10030261 TaxID=3273420 RepID=UPI0036091451